MGITLYSSWCLPKSLPPQKGGSYSKSATLEGFLENSETAQLSKLLSYAVIKIFSIHLNILLHI